MFCKQGSTEQTEQTEQINQSIDLLISWIGVMIIVQYILFSFDRKALERTFSVR